jgi:hypothetical protein
MTAESSDQPSPEPGLVPLAKPGARWTPEEQEILVTEVREGKDMTAIMDHHGRNRTGIEERLVMMVPDEAQIPDDEKLGWIFSRRAWRTASAPSTACPATMIPGSAASMAAKPSRTMAWSSVIRQRMTLPLEGRLSLVKPVRREGARPTPRTRRRESARLTASRQAAGPARASRSGRALAGGRRLAARREPLGRWSPEA